jgi:hypothetical protein
VRLSDEEVVYALVTERERFERRAFADAKSAGVTWVELDDVRPGGSVAARIVVGLRSRERPSRSSPASRPR